MRDLIDKMILNKNSFFNKNVITEKYEVKLTNEDLFLPSLNKKKIIKINKDNTNNTNKINKTNKHNIENNYNFPKPKKNKYYKGELFVFNKVEKILYNTRNSFISSIEKVNKFINNN